MNESSKGNNEDAKMDWMYRDSSQIVDKEEYLLGRKVDKQFEKNMLPTDKDRDCLPSSIFLNSESQVDAVRKFQEDPLYLIKKKEIESREQLLKNPRKMKQLQEMIAKQQAAAEKLKRKEIKRKKKIYLDSQLVKKCKHLFGSVDIKKLEALSSVSESSSEDDGKLSNKDHKSLDEQIAAKYKKLLGNMDAKQLAEMNTSSSSDSDHSRTADDQRIQPRSTDFKNTKDRHKHKEVKTNSSKTHSDNNRITTKDSFRKKRHDQHKSSPENENLHGKEKVHSADKSFLTKKYSNESDKLHAKYESQAPKRKSRTSERRDSVSESSDCSSNDRHSSKQGKSKLRSKEKTHTSKMYYEKSDKYCSKYNNDAPKRMFKSSKRKKSSSESSHSSSDGSCNAKMVKDKLSSRDKKETSNVNSGERSERQAKHQLHGPKRKFNSSKRGKSSSESDDGSSDDSYTAKKKELKKKKKRKNREESVESVCSPHNDVKKKKKKEKMKPKKANYKSSNSESSSEDSVSSKKLQQRKQYGLVLPDNYVPKVKPKEETVSKKNVDQNETPVKMEPKRKLTEKEKEQRLKEMMNNAKWREDLRDKNIKSHNEKLKSEKDDYIYNEDFMRKQMALAVSQGTVESRVKANINSIQRSGSSMNEHFARRH